MTINKLKETFLVKQEFIYNNLFLVMGNYMKRYLDENAFLDEKANPVQCTSNIVSTSVYNEMHPIGESNMTTFGGNV